MRITFVLPLPSLSGGVRVVAEYAKHLSERGHTVTVVSTGLPPKPPVWQRIRRRLSRLKRGDICGAFFPTHPPIHNDHFDAVPHLHTLLPHAGPVTDRDVPDADIVLSTWWETVPWVANLSPSKGRKIHFLQHDERAMATDDAIARRIGDVSWKTPGFRRVAVASWIKDIGQREFGVSDCVVMSNAVDHDHFNAEPRELGNPPAVGFMTSAVRFKGSDIAQQAWQLARERVPNLRLVTFGTSIDPDLPLPPEAEHHNKPPQTTIADVYRSCDAWLFASRCEGFGLPILEAMACRTPVIGTPTGAGPDLINDTNGRLVAMEDVSAMADAIVAVVTQPAGEWRQMSDAALATAHLHAWPAATDRFEAFLKDVAQTPG